MWKSGVAGLFTGGFTATGGVIGLADEGLLGKLAYQGIGSASRSIGQNWASGNSLFSRVQVGIGPINLTFGAGKKLLQSQNNIGNAFTNGLGFLNLVTNAGGIGGNIQFDSSNLTFAYSGGWLGKFWNAKIPGIGRSLNGTGAHSIISSSKLSLGSKFFAHEARHVWQSRVMGDSFVFNYFLQGTISGGPWYYGNYYEATAEYGW